MEKVKKMIFFKLKEVQKIGKKYIKQKARIIILITGH